MANLPRPYPPKFLELIKEVTIEEDEKRARESSGEIRHNPSSASFKKSDGTIVGSCLRELYYKATKAPVSDPKQFTSKLQGGFGQGIHDFLTDKLVKSKHIKIMPEVGGRVNVDPLTKEISFRLDGLVTYRGDIGGLEIKTMQSFGLQRMIREGGVKEKDILQVLSYFGTNEAIRWFTLLYFGRDTAIRAEYHIWKDPNTNEFMIEGVLPVHSARPIRELNFNGIVARWVELEKHLEAKTLPPRDYKAVLTKEGEVTEKRTKNHVEYKTATACLYCQWQTKCWSEADAKNFAVKLD